MHLDTIRSRIRNVLLTRRAASGGKQAGTELDMYECAILDLFRISRANHFVHLVLKIKSEIGDGKLWGINQKLIAKT